MTNRTYRYFSGKPLFPFGHGLSYTHFDYRVSELAGGSSKPGEKLNLTVNVRNTGDRDGEDVVQVYFKHSASPVPQPLMALCDFKRVAVPRGQTVQVKFEIPVERLRYWDTEKKQYRRPGHLPDGGGRFLGQPFLSSRLINTGALASSRFLSRQTY